VLDFVPEDERGRVLKGMEEALQGWLTWRDEVAHLCGVSRAALAQP
jgi:hypothetical protein